MRATWLTARRARIEVSMDGVTFTRAESDAADRGVARRTHLDWDDVAGARLETTRKGRLVIRVAVVGRSAPAHHRNDPCAIKVPRSQGDAAHRLVAQIEDEVAARRSWRRQSPSRVPRDAGPRGGHAEEHIDAKGG